MRGSWPTGAVVPVGSERGEFSSSAAMIEAEQAAETFVVDDLARVRKERGTGVDKFVADSLVRPLGIEMDCVGI